MRPITAYSKSSSFIISFIFMTLLFVGVAFNTYVLTVANDDLLIRETEAAILADIGGFHSLYNNAGRSAVIEAIDERTKKVNNDFFYFFRDANEDYLAGNLADWPSQDVMPIRNGLLDITTRLRQGYETLDNEPEQNAIAMLVEFPDKESLLIARSVRNYEVSVRLAEVSSWVMIIIVSIISIISIGVAYYVVSRINLIASTADNIISEGDLSERLNVDSEWDDLSKLTLSLNQLLDKVEQSVNGIRAVSDNIAHDLRTPLTRLRSKIEELPEQDNKYQLINECDNLLAIFNSLLRITYIETNAKRAGFETVDISLVVEDAIELYLPMMEDKGIAVKSNVKSQIFAYCDRSLMFQVFANIIDNAVKFTPSEGRIQIALSVEKKFIIFSVSDSGVGVSKDKLDKLTERFYREEKSRTSSGNGLGLSLVAAIVTLHNAHLDFAHNEDRPGLLCTVKVPNTIAKKAVIEEKALKKVIN